MDKGSGSGVGECASGSVRMTARKDFAEEGDSMAAGVSDRR